MKVDNFEQIERFISERFDSEMSFYFLQILQRKKDFNEDVKSVRIVRTYYIYNIDYLESKKNEIIKLCEENKARAYININQRSAEAVGFKMLKEVADAIYNKQFEHLSRIYDSCCGQVCSAKEKLWLIDIDEQNMTTTIVEDIERYVNSMKPETESSKLKLIVPTRHGLHLFVTPFDRHEFNMKFPNIDLHKDNPTLLYYPESIDLID